MPPRQQPSSLATMASPRPSGLNWLAVLVIRAVAVSNTGIQIQRQLNTTSVQPASSQTTNISVTAGTPEVPNDSRTGPTGTYFIGLYYRRWTTSEPQDQVQRGDHPSQAVANGVHEPAAVTIRGNSLSLQIRLWGREMRLFSSRRLLNTFTTLLLSSLRSRRNGVGHGAVVSA
jgi:hypothetical protein